MDFYQWMIGSHLHTPGPFGALAKDMSLDDYEGANTHRSILAHLHECGAIDACIETFNRCWAAYRKAHHGRPIPPDCPLHTSGRQANKRG